MIIFVTLLIMQYVNTDNPQICNTYIHQDNSNKSICNSIKLNNDNYSTYTHYIQQCDYYQRCNYFSNSDKGQNCIMKANEIPGEYCYYDSNCHSSNCLNFYCEGKAKNSICKSHIDCNKGLVCLNRHCSLPLKEGDKCNDDYECDLNLGCLYNKCTRYYSLKAGFESPDVKFCESLVIINGICREIQLVDKDGNDRNDFLCSNINEGCRYKINGLNQYFTTSCVCSLSSSYKKYCTKDNSSKFDGLSKRLYDSIDLSTHTLRRNYYSKSTSTDDKALNEYPLYENASNDLIEILTPSKYVDIFYCYIMLVLLLIIN